MTGLDALRVIAQQVLGETPPPPSGTPGHVFQAHDELIVFGGVRLLVKLPGDSAAPANE